MTQKRFSLLRHFCFPLKNQAKIFKIFNASVIVYSYLPDNLYSTVKKKGNGERQACLRLMPGKSILMKIQKSGGNKNGIL